VKKKRSQKKKKKKNSLLKIPVEIVTSIFNVIGGYWVDFGNFGSGHVWQQRGKKEGQS